MKVTEIELQLRQVWNDVLTKHSLLDSNDWYVVEISKVLQYSDTRLPLTTASSRS
jgi:hypothetical protein